MPLVLALDEVFPEQGDPLVGQDPERCSCRRGDQHVALHIIRIFATPPQQLLLERVDLFVALA